MVASVPTPTAGLLFGSQNGSFAGLEASFRVGTVAERFPGGLAAAAEQLRASCADLERVVVVVYDPDWTLDLVGAVVNRLDDYWRLGLRFIRHAQSASW